MPGCSTHTRAQREREREKEREKVCEKERLRYSNNNKKIQPAKSTHLTNNRLNPPINRPHQEHMSATIRAPPNPNAVLIHLLSQLRIRNRILQIRNLFRGHDVRADAVRARVAGADAAVVVD